MKKIRFSHENKSRWSGLLVTEIDGGHRGNLQSVLVRNPEKRVGPCNY